MGVILFTGSRHCALFELLTQRPNHTIAATTPHPLNASALAQVVAMPVSHGTFQPCAGTSVASVSSFIAGASQIIIIRPAAFVQRTGKTTFAGLRSVRLRGKRSRLWHGQLGIEPTTHGFGDRVATLVHVPAYCSLRAEPKPRPSGKEGGKEKRMEMQSLSLHPHVITSFLIVAFRCATSLNFCVHVWRVLFFYRAFFQRAIAAAFSKRALAPFCSGYTARYGRCTYSKMPRNRAHTPAALKI